MALAPPDSALSSPEAGPPPPDDGVWLGVTSSGSTGLPKRQWRRWSELRMGTAVRPETAGWTWASPYEPWTFAGVQVAVQAWAGGGRVVTLDTDWDRAWATLRAEQPEAVSATPTYFDLLIQNETPGAVPWTPRQVTLGGEPLRPAIGTRIHARFPAARFTVIYAMAELGVLLKTGRVDGWYEHAYLDRHGRTWRVTDGVLEIRRGEQWWSTGDRVEVNGDLIRVVGRADQVANVGGTKVSLVEVAEAAEQVPGVWRAAAVAEPNPVTGQIVCLHYAVSPDADPAEVTAALQNALRRRLRKEAWPRRWVLDAVGPGRNAKRRVAGD